MKLLAANPLNEIRSWEAPRKAGCLELTDRGWKEQGHIGAIQDIETVH